MSLAADLWTLLAGLFFRVNIMFRNTRTSAPRARTVFVLDYPSHIVLFLPLTYSLNQYLQWHHHRNLSSTSGPCFASGTDRFVSPTNGRLPVTRGQFSFDRIFFTIKYGLVHNARKPCWITGTTATFLDMRGSRVDPIRSCGLLSPNMRTYLPLVCGPFSCTMTKSRKSINGRWGWQPEGDPVIAHLLQHAGIGVCMSHRLSSKDMRQWGVIFQENSLIRAVNRKKT